MQAEPETFIRLRQLIRDRYVPFSKPTLWRRVKDGTFPQPIRLSPGVTAWRLSDITAWQTSRPNFSNQ
jgi:predicted DNA-binding transcriptional regulator AlpA